MSKASFARLVVLCAALAACSDAGTRAVTAPEAGPSLSEASADYNLGYSVDEPFSGSLAAEETFAQLGAVQMAASAQAAGGGRASGHVGFPFGLPGLGLASEKYSFVALTTDASTFAAKGEYELQLTTVTGRQNRIHGDVVCMGITGNTARVAGQIRQLWVNNVQVPIPVAPTHNYWVVIDNGEGQATVDFVSPMAFTIAAGAQAHCAAGLPSVVFPLQEGNVQVQP